MKNDYNKMTKAELIKKIKRLESEKKKREKEFSPGEKEELNYQINLRDAQIEHQKFELLDKQMELESSRDKYADLYDFAPTGYVTLDAKGSIVEINLTGAALLGFQARHAKIHSFIQFIEKNDITRFLTFLKKCKTSDTNCVDEFTLINKKDGHIIVQLNALSYQDYRTKSLSFRISISDITQKRIAEKAMHESEERFRLMADASPSMIWMTDSSNKLEYMNKTKLDFLGKKLEDLINDGWMDTRHPEDKEKFLAELNKAAKEKEGFSIEIRVLNKKNEYRWLLEAAAPRFLPDGTFIGFVGSGMDVTDRKESRLKIEKSLKEKEVLLKEIHHRVKNNLQVISSLLNLQRNYITNEEMLNIFRSSQSRISAMALLHEKLYGSKNLSRIDIKDYVISISRSLLDTYKDTAKDVRINFDIDKINLDLDISINLGLIINELVSNSLKYAFRGKESGRIKIALNKVNSNDLMLMVSDNGIGLPENFDQKRKNSLGLELVSNIVEQIQGKLDISKNRETEFKIIVSRN